MKANTQTTPDTLPPASKAPGTAFAEGINILFGILGMVGGGVIVGQGLSKGVQLTQVVGAVVMGAALLQMALVNLVIYLAKQAHASRQETAWLIRAAEEARERQQRHGECLDFMVQAAAKEDRYQSRLGAAVAARDSAWQG